MAEISVLMSVYNGEKFVVQAIDSILAQTFEDFELIIIDDGSTDRSWELITSYSDARIRPYRLETNIGVGGALQYGLSLVEGKYVAKADSDDIHHPTRLEKQRAYLEQNTGISLVKTLMRYFPHDAETERSSRYLHMKDFQEEFKNCVMSTEDIQEKLYWTSCIVHSTIMVRTAAIQAVGYDPELRIAEDYKMMYELNKKGFRMATLEEVLVDVRVINTSITATENFILWDIMYKIKEQEIRRLFGECNRVFLWGASEKGKAVEGILNKQGLFISGFIDSDLKKQQESTSGYNVYGPSMLEPGDKIIITSRPGLFAIGNELKRRGFKSLIDFIGF